MAHNFFAFISYRHTDIKAAKRLQFLLESYNFADNDSENEAGGT